MGSKEDRPSIISTYDYKRPYNVSDLTAALFNRAALSDTTEEDRQEARQKGKKRRDNE